MDSANTAFLPQDGAARDLHPATAVAGWRRGKRAELRRVVEGFDRELPRFGWKGLERYLGGGDPQNGSAWLVCEWCDGHRLVPFPCKGRAFCPCCCGRRKAELAARWCDTLFAEVPHRPWVVTVPWPRRRLLAWRPELARGALDVAWREVFGWLVSEAERQHGVGERGPGR